MIGAAAACRLEGPLELHWDKVCVLSTIGPATIACYERKRRDLNLNPRRVPSHNVGVSGCPMAALTSHKPHWHVFTGTSCCGYPMRNLS